MMEVVWSARPVARELSHSDCVVRWRSNQWIRCMSFTRKPGSGHLNATSYQEDHHIIRNALALLTASSTANQAHIAPSLGSPVAVRTIRKRLAERHLGSRCPLHALPFTPNHRRLRLKWCLA
ncbi:transposable element Tcb2 transposase [Trichonephila clavipes]|nr:transposable element Tcb2 transposase [Trichonephila clavipes]